MAAGFAGCGGTSKTAAKPEVVEEEPAAPADEETVDVSSVCSGLCERVATQCEEDPTADFDAEACEDSCLDETDGVLDEVGRCLDGADSCGAAVTCRDKFGD